MEDQGDQVRRIPLSPRFSVSDYPIVVGLRIDKANQLAGIISANRDYVSHMRSGSALNILARLLRARVSYLAQFRNRLPVVSCPAKRDGWNSSPYVIQITMNYLMAFDLARLLETRVADNPVLADFANFLKSQAENYSRARIDMIVEPAEPKDPEEYQHSRVLSNVS